MADQEKDQQLNQDAPSEATESAVQDATAEKLQCNVSVTDSGPWKKKVAVQIPRVEIDKELNKEYRELMRSAEVPGFRKGRAPRRLVEKRFGEDVTSQAKLRLLAQAFEQIDEEQDFEILGEPDFDPEKITLPETGDLSFEYEVEIKPKFDLPALEGIKIEKPLTEVTDERISEALLSLRLRQGHFEDITTGGAIENDLVVADVTMKVEGVDQPETLENHPIRVGHAALMGVMVEDMANVLGGATIGQSKTCTATVSDSHAKEANRGKKAEFTIQVKGIRRLIPAELNEPFFTALGVADEQELRKYVEESLASQADRDVRNVMKQQVYDYLDKAVTFELPTGVAARYADRVLVRRYYELMQQGVRREQIDENIEQLKTASSEQAAKQLKTSFIMDRVADKLEIEVSEAEVNGWIAQIAGMYHRRPEKVREEMHREGRLTELQSQIRDEKAIDRILEMAEVVDAPIKEASAQDEKAPKDAAEKPKKKKAAPKKDVKRQPPQGDSE